MQPADPGLAAERERASDLVRRIQAGEREAEAELVKHYSRGLRFLLKRRTGDRQLAEDFLQETWAVALTRIRDRGLEQPERLAGFLTGIANNLVQSNWRRVERQRTTIDSELVDLARDESSSPFTRISRAEVCHLVRALLNELGQPRDREILERYYVQEEDKERICDDLHLDGAHFNRVLFRARERFRELVMRHEMRQRLSVVN